MPPRKKLKTSQSVAPKTTSSAPPPDTNVPVASSQPHRRRRRCLALLQEFPVDVLLEIFGLLHPKDLLNLARTSKNFRAFFLNRDKRLLWKSALSNVEELPPCPPFLDEPAYAHVMFDSFCHNCGSAAVHKVIWTWFVRYCSNCCFDQRQWQIMLDSCSNPAGLAPIMAMKDKYFNSYFRHGNAYYHKLQIDTFLSKWSSVSGGDIILQEALFQKQREDVAERDKHAHICEDWFQRRQWNRAIELDDIRHQRALDIIARLKAEGWDCEIRYFGTGYVMKRMRDIPVVKQPAKLTKRSWPKVYSALQDILNEMRTELRKREPEDRYYSRLKNLEDAVLACWVQLPRTPQMDLRPDYRNLVGIQDCKELIMAPKERTITTDDFMKILPAARVTWEADCVEELSSKVRAAIPSIPDEVDPLSLAIARFECHTTYCSGVAHRYPDCLAHTCSYELRPGERGAYERYLGFVRRATARRLDGQHPGFRGDFQPGTAKVCLYRNDSGVIRMRYIVAAMGLDPVLATHEDLENCNGRLRCTVCWSKERRVYTWETAFGHSHYGAAVDRDFWERISEGELEKVLSLEVPIDPLKTRQAIWSCSLCPAWDSWRDDMENHLKFKHDIDDFDKSVEDGTVYLHLDQCTIFKRSIILPPDV